MSGPTSIGDADLAWWSNDIYVAIEVDFGKTVYLTQNLTTATPADWEIILDADDYPEFEELFFGRVKFDPVDQNKIYVIGYCIGAANYDCHIFKSTNLGVTWTHRLVREGFAAIYGDYAVTYQSESKTQTGTADFEFSQEHARTGDEESTYNPWALAYRLSGPVDAGEWNYLTGGTDTIHDFSGSATAGADNKVWGHHNDLMGVTERGIANDWMDEYFGTWDEQGGINRNMPNDEDRIYINFGINHVSTGTYTFTGESWVFWNYPKIIISFAFDIARTNNNWMYVGFVDAIYKSEDNGYTWQPLIETEGAYDILVDPSIAGAIYYWSANLSDFANPAASEGLTTPGNKTSHLRLMVAGVVVDTLEHSIACNATCRIAKSLNTGKIWTTLQPLFVMLWGLGMRYLGAWSAVLGGSGSEPIIHIVNFRKGLIDGYSATGTAMGLKMYLGDKGIYVDGKYIYTTEDGWATSAAKIGGWAGYSYGVIGHRMTETT